MGEDPKNRKESKTFDKTRPDLSVVSHKKEFLKNRYFPGYRKSLPYPIDLMALIEEISIRFPLSVCNEKFY